MENMHCEKHQVLAAKIKSMAAMGVIVDFPLCKECDELQFGKVIHEDMNSCWNENPESCCKKS